MKILVSWSTGKDSAWMLHVLNREYPGAAAGLLTTTNEAFDRVAMHAVRRELLEAQAAAAGLPLHVVPLPWPCSNAQYESIMKTAIEGFVSQGFTHVAFGDLFLEDVRRYREDRLAGTGLEPLFPIWKTKPTVDLAHDMIEGGLQARITCVDPRKLDRSVRGPGIRSRVAARSAPRRRSLRRERRVSFVRVRRPDVQGADRADGWRGRRPGRLCVRGLAIVSVTSVAWI